MCSKQSTVLWREGGLTRAIELERIIAEGDVDELARALRAAESAHHAFEQETGLDTDWPRWYALYLLGLREEVRQ